MRIAVISNWYFPFYGGAQTAIQGIHGHMLSNNEVTILTPLRDNSPLVEKMEGITVRRFRNVWAGPTKPYIKSDTFCPGMFWHLLKNNYDIFHCYPHLSPNTNLALYVHTLKGTPIYLTIFDFLNYTSYKLDHFPAPDLLDSFVQSKSRLRRFAFGKKLASFNAVFSIAPTEREFISRFNRYAELMPLGIAPEDYDSAERGAFRKRYGLGGRPLVLACGRVTPHKGQDLAVEVAAHVVKKFPEAVFVLAGVIYDEAYYEQIVRRVGELKLEKNVLFTKAVTRAEITQAYVDCDLHLVPVRFMNSGLVILEGWAAGKALVQSDRVDPNLVQEGVNGITYPLSNIQAGAEAVCRLLHDEKLRASMGAAGRKKVRDSYTWDKVAAFVTSTYAETLSRK